LGGKHHVSLNDAAKLVSKITGKNDVVYLEPRHEVKHAWSSYEKSELLLGYEENTSLERGLELMWEWAKSQKPRKRVFWPKYELEKNIYSYWQVKE
jgi:UDP-glucose 4-epimerase